MKQVFYLLLLFDKSLPQKIAFEKVELLNVGLAKNIKIQNQMGTEIIKY